MYIFKLKDIFWGTILVFVFWLNITVPCYAQEIPKLVIPRFDKGDFVSSNQYILNRLMEILAIGGKLEVVGPELVKHELEKKKSDSPLTYQWEDMMNVGRQLESDLVLWGGVDKREIKIKSGLSIPYILTKYQHQAEIKVSLKMFDLQKGEMILVKSFEVVILGTKGTAWFIHPEKRPEKDLSPLEEDKFLRQAEEKVALDIAKTIFKVLKKKG